MIESENIHRVFFRIIVMVLSGMLIALLPSCGKPKDDSENWKTYAAAVAEAKHDKDLIEFGMHNIDAVKEFNRLFPEAHNDLTADEHFKAHAWDSEALLYDRYILTLEFLFKQDSSGTSFSMLGNPHYRINEVEKIESITRFLSSDIPIGPEKWKQLREANGEAKTVFPELIIDSPVKDLKAKWKNWNSTETLFATHPEYRQ